MKILEAEHLTKTYGKGEMEIRALDDVSFEVENGEFVSVVDFFNEMIEMLGLKGREHDLPRQLSGGQQQRVAIGWTLITKKKGL